ncbi:hypothetical protein acdb102_28690 [Acidothermaceae bacterium B102]|nr:hypothetical protein acdb102_28690 [Acidothermaceae bacterium B102]
MTVKDVQARYDADAEAYATWWAPVLRRTMQSVLDSIDWTGVETALEVGCGTGGVLDAMPSQALTVGVDATFGMLSYAPRTHALLQGDAQRLPLQDSTFDVAITGFMLQHVPRPDLAFSELGRVLRPGGQLGVAAWGGEVTTWEGERIFSEELDAVGAPAAPPTVQPGRSATNTGARLKALAEAAGFQATVTSLPLAWQPDADEVLGQLSNMRGTGRRLAQLTPEAAGIVTSRVRERLDNAEISCWPAYPVLFLSGKRVNLRHN